MTFTIFERLRAGIDLPSVFGASNASREQAMIWDKLKSVWGKPSPTLKRIDIK
ncbi:hypothetical protein [Necropsobacter massiliensis]|uniref:hypothetical protein n=1 Tax=Necropsobacter massiliensis TaxID=1400001 RepID=UPI000A8C43FC|nr:hypothetical protein [Necropsobacter massiliensis]